MAVLRIGPFDPFPPQRPPDAALFCFHGENDALIRERMGLLRGRFAAGGPADGVDLDGDQLAREPFALADEIGSPSLFAARRFIRVVLTLKSAREAFRNALAPLAGAEGVLVAVDAGADARHEDLLSDLRNSPQALVVACPADNPEDLAAFAQRSLAEAGVTVEREVARELVDLADADRALLRNELEKLALLAHGRAGLDPAEIRQTVADEAGLALDDAVRRVFAGDAAAAVDAADRVAASGADAGALVGAALRVALWNHRNAAAIRDRGATLRHAVSTLADAVRVSRSNNKLADAEAERALVRVARMHRR